MDLPDQRREKLRQHFFKLNRKRLQCISVPKVDTSKRLSRFISTAKCWALLISRKMKAFHCSDCRNIFVRKSSVKFAVKISLALHFAKNDVHSKVLLIQIGQKIRIAGAGHCREAWLKGLPTKFVTTDRTEYCVKFPMCLRDCKRCGVSPPAISSDFETELCVAFF